MFLKKFSKSQTKLEGAQRVHISTKRTW